MADGFDLIVVGGGNAALCAAIAGAEAGARVLVLERAPEAESGGNSRFTGGTIRFAYDGLEDLLPLAEIMPEERRRTDFGAYPEAQFFDDMARVTQNRTDPDLCETLVRQSRSTMRWLRAQGVRFQPIYGRQTYTAEDGTQRFWGGLVLESWGGGPGLVAALTARCRRLGVEIRYATRALGLLMDGATVRGVEVQGKPGSSGGRAAIPAAAVVLATGGFQANTEMRARYLGPGWDLATVRGSRFNTGDGIRMALAAGAASHGHWSGCHAVQWDFSAPPFGDLAVGDQFQKHSYPYGVLVNAEGRRFLDEGADLRLFTYAKYGRRVLEQPGGFAWQVFDAAVAPLLRDEYRIRQVTRVRADSLEELAGKLEGVDAAGFLAEIGAYNAAVRSDIPFRPGEKDGRRTEGLAIPKSNWANPISTPPFEAYQVGCGISFTFGGLRIDAGGRVLDELGAPIPGLYAAGELVGGLFYFNYPAGSGLMAGAVFGRLAGTSAAARRNAPRGGAADAPPAVMSA
ncbi:FAD-dependent tricarballylate dehydrogenase TcuA [Roseomonas sp. NAR14]|uniref:FAD-dependent tricarballylate dehydrogenase TcuA n=1 Tax=Roseomonas acroporae TaxID=2937791 RepID=A0A9X1YER7_9PROT|nr:FAD-dependent tricarballylate dehydrogenase TcuA [Roseomonas acroporae]MCK8787760.1 FAD-dependent tricarballylate dehydrogenase TcuA [Roseomonas acroporae]